MFSDRQHAVHRCRLRDDGSGGVQLVARVRKASCNGGWLESYDGDTAAESTWALLPPASSKKCSDVDRWHTDSQHCSEPRPQTTPAKATSGQQDYDSEALLLTITGVNWLNRNACKHIFHQWRKTFNLVCILTYLDFTFKIFANSLFVELLVMR